MRKNKIEKLDVRGREITVNGKEFFYTIATREDADNLVNMVYQLIDEVNKR